MRKDSAALVIFALSENSTRSDEAIVWKRTENCPKCLTKNYEMTEKLLLENPMYVYFDSKMTLTGRFNNYPCLIDASSTPLAKVLMLLIFHIFEYIQFYFC